MIINKINSVSFKGDFIGELPEGTRNRHSLESKLQSEAERLHKDIHIMLLGKNNIVPCKIKGNSIVGAGIAGPSIDFNGTIDVVCKRIKMAFEELIKLNKEAENDIIPSTNIRTPPHLHTFTLN